MSNTVPVTPLGIEWVVKWLAEYGQLQLQLMQDDWTSLSNVLAIAEVKVQVFVQIDNSEHVDIVLGKEQRQLFVNVNHVDTCRSYN